MGYYRVLSRVPVFNILDPYLIIYFIYSIYTYIFPAIILVKAMVFPTWSHDVDEVGLQECECRRIIDENRQLVLEKTLRSHLDCKKIKQSTLKSVLNIH